MERETLSVRADSRPKITIVTAALVALALLIGVVLVAKRFFTPRSAPPNGGR